MKHKRPPILAIIVILLLLLIGGYFGIRALVNKGATALTASGTIEATEITISPEIGGKVAEVKVDQGSAVKAGVVLFRWTTAFCRLKSGRGGIPGACQGSLRQRRCGSCDRTGQLRRCDQCSPPSCGCHTHHGLVDSQPDRLQPSGGYFDQADLIAAAQDEVDTATSALTTLKSGSLPSWLTRPTWLSSAPRRGLTRRGQLSWSPRMSGRVPTRPIISTCVIPPSRRTTLPQQN